MRLMVCITMYNEPYKQVCESLAGVYRNYYELVSKDQTYEGRVGIVIVQDGFEQFNKIGADDSSKYLANQKFQKAGIFDPDVPFRAGYFNQKLKTGNRDDKMKKSNKFASREYVNTYSDLAFISNNIWEKKDTYKSFETHNMVHCFSRKMKFTDFLKGMELHERQALKINKYEAGEFMLGSDKAGDVSTQIFEHLEIDVHLVIKHRNRGKIESHLWFFKGFCNTIDPEF